MGLVIAGVRYYQMEIVGRSKSSLSGWSGCPETAVATAVSNGPLIDCTQDIINLRDRLQRAEKNAEDLEKQLHEVRAQRSDMHGHHEVDAKVDERPSGTMGKIDDGSLIEIYAQDIINLRDRLQRAEKNAEDLEKQLHEVRAQRSDMHRPSEKELMEAMHNTKADAENWDSYQSKKIIAALKRCGLVKP